MGRTLVEDFAEGPAGWMRWGDALTLDDVQGGGAFRPLEYSGDEEGGAVTTRSPWWIGKKPLAPCCLPLLPVPPPPLPPGALHP